MKTAAPEPRTQHMPIMLMHGCELDMAPWFRILCTQFGWADEEKLYEKLSAHNTKQLEQFESDMEDAKSNLGMCLYFGFGLVL